MNNDYDQPVEDEIGMRAYIQMLWKARKVILIVTLAAVIVAFVVSFWVLPRKYQATAYLLIGPPAMNFSKSTTDSGWTISPITPDIIAMVELSTAPVLLEKVLKDPAVTAAFGNEIIFTSNLTSMVTAVALGTDQISLQVTDSDPQRAALLANTWAEKMTEVVNATYGLGALKQTLDSQVLQSQNDYNQAEVTLEDALSKSQVSALSAKLESMKGELDTALASIVLANRVLDDLQFFEQGLSGQPNKTPLSLGDGLALTTLRQRSLTVGSASYTIQIDSASFTGFTVSMALEATTQMRAGLQAQLTRLQNDQIRLEQDIPLLKRDLTNAGAQLAKFTLNRDQSQDLYAALLQQQRQVTTVLAQSTQVAIVSVEALPPDKKSSPKTMTITAVAGMLGLMLSVFGTLAVNWWRNNGDNVQ